MTYQLAIQIWLKQKLQQKFGNYSKLYYIEYFLHTPTNVGVLWRTIFSHKPDEAMSGGLAKACVQRKNCSVPERNLSSLLNTKTLL